ncbi:hypothetical protein NKI12_09815 [Mesorhizobium australicum]|uniref:Uncharacterized protein n=1 Tax=Mesorhizobium australicum TaxID=536018 RepID=A0ACC6SXI7_9HYPH
MLFLDRFLAGDLRPGGGHGQGHEQGGLQRRRQPARAERKIVDDQKLQADDDKDRRARQPEVERAVVDDGMLVTHRMSGNAEVGSGVRPVLPGGGQ